MLIYRKEGQVAQRPHLNLPENSFEEEIGLEGFLARFLIFIIEIHPLLGRGFQKSSFQWQEKSDSKEEFLKPQCYKKFEGRSGEDFYSSQRLAFWNDEIAIHLHNIDKGSPIYFRNADASEVYFCHEGEFENESPFGKLKVKAGDYCHIPRGVTYRWSSGKGCLLRIESFRGRFKKPPTGILGQQALYHEQDIQTPVFQENLNKEKSVSFRVQKEGRLTEVEHDFDIRNLAGWCGTLYPFVLSVKNIAPVMSPMAHLPPSVNATFVTDHFIVCTFLPRPLEEPEGALKVPFFHSNIDYDEVIFYHEGDFFSRDNMGKGYMTLHPRGINHGPHPKALKNSGSKKRTDEIAVMIDAVHPLKVSKTCRDFELPDYWKSWMA